MTHDITRRSLTRGAAWAVPAVTVASAAPAVAASAGCAAGRVTVDLTGGQRKILSTGASGMPSKIQWTSTDAATGVTTTIVTTAIGSTILGKRTGYAKDSYLDTDLTSTETGLNIQHVTSSGAAPGTGGEGEDVTISFSRAGKSIAVKNFLVYIDDIDTLEGNWTDGVTLTAPDMASTQGSNVDGSGSDGTTGNVTSGPWHAGDPIDPAKDRDGSKSVNLPEDRVTLTAGAIQYPSFRYFNLPRTQVAGAAAGTNSDQNIQLTGMQFDAPAC